MAREAHGTSKRWERSACAPTRHRWGQQSGDTNAAHVKLTDEGYEVSHVVKGDSISDVLKYVEYQPEAMVEAVRRQAERAVQSGRLSNEQMRTLMQHYEQALRSYTYLTDGD